MNVLLLLVVWLYKCTHTHTVFQLDRCDKFLEERRGRRRRNSEVKLQPNCSQTRKNCEGEDDDDLVSDVAQMKTTAFQVAEIFMVVASRKKSIEEISGQLEEWRGDGQIAAAVFVFVYQWAEENSPFSVFNSSELFSLINRWIGQQFSVCDCSGEEEEERKRKWQREERELAADRFICLYLPAVCCLEFNAPN